MGPEFICIGAQKAGTTWLYTQLQNHPEFSMLPKKELHYFDRDSKYPSANDLAVSSFNERRKNPLWIKKVDAKFAETKGSEDPGLHRWWSNYFLSDYCDAWYLSLFSDCSGIVGDITPSYSILDSDDIGRVHQLVGNVKIILMIRNPIERAWSMLRYFNRIESSICLEDFSAFKSEVDDPAQERRSDYINIIDAYREYFGRESMLIGFYDAIGHDPRSLLHSIYSYLGVENLDIGYQHRSLSINVNDDVEMPEQFRSYLVDKYLSDIEELARRYESYARIWLQNINGQSKTNLELNPTFHP